ncbi:MAG TPA: tagatose 1,6-diphosphate aldolase [Caldisericia bacterium]|nr:tagatose 1,6-diphosphate aldolase [Caldisericia bacterium]HQL67079.1 tagatose 1,6-diphosphate aldolase [Caldisericia bacterium]
MDKHYYLTPGKFKGLKKLADETGRFRMLAIDQRGSLRKMLSKATGKDGKDITYQDMALAKWLVIDNLSPYFSATLTCPQYGLPEGIRFLDRDSALLLAIEESGTKDGGYKNREKLTNILDGWSVEKIKRAGADAVKLLLHYRPDSSKEIKERQENIVKMVGAEAKRLDFPFVLEPMSFPFKDDEVENEANFIRRKPEIVVKTVEEFSKEEYGVDILKLEFPVDLKFVDEFSYGAFDEKEREAVFSIDDAYEFCESITQTSRVPWVILSAGVDIEEFLINVEIASESGASGFLAGRAVWKEFTKFFPNIADMNLWLKTTGVERYYKLVDVSVRAMPYFEHPLFQSLANLRIEDEGEEWYLKYKEFKGEKSKTKEKGKEEY